jgi:hypothetical protein
MDDEKTIIVKEPPKELKKYSEGKNSFTILNMISFAEDPKQKSSDEFKKLSHLDEKEISGSSDSRTILKIISAENLNQKKSSHKNKPFSDAIEKIGVMTEATLIGIFSRWATWPLEKVFYDYSKKNQPHSYQKLILHNFQPKVLLELNKNFLTTGLSQTGLKAFANLAPMAIINKYYPDLSANQKALAATALCTPLETYFTKDAEQLKVIAFRKMQDPTSISINYGTLSKTEIRQVTAATFMRVGWSSLITFEGIYQATELFKTLFPKMSADHPTLVKPIASFFSAFSTQLLIMPVVNFQSYVFTHDNTNQSFLTTIKKFHKEHTWKQLVQGGLGRGIHRGLLYGLTFFIDEQMKQYHESQQFGIKEKNPIEIEVEEKDRSMQSTFFY